MSVSKTILNSVLFLLFFIRISGQTVNSGDRPAGGGIYRLADEQIFLITDRDDYIAGEVIWFSSWLTENQGSELSQNSSIARVEVLNARSEQVARSTFLLNGGRGFGQLKLSDTLGSGLYTIRAYTNLMRNFSSASWYEKNISIFNAYNNPENYPAETGTHKENLLNTYFAGEDGIQGKLPAEDDESGLRIITCDSMSTREKVVVELEFPDQGAEVELCVAVVPLNSVRQMPISLAGSIPESLKGRKDAYAKYLNESDCYFVGGRLVSKTGRSSPSGLLVYLSVPGRVPVFKYARTDENGKFLFKIWLDEQIDEFIIQTDPVAAGYQIVMESNFAGDPVPTGLPGPGSGISPPDHIKQMSINAQVAMAYSISALGSQIEPVSAYREHLRFYGKPYREVFVRDFIQLSSMEEIFFEIIPGVSLIKTMGRYEMQMKNSLGQILYDTPPVMMIDGVIIRDPSIIAGMHPEETEKIEIVQDQYMVGDCLFNGIVNVITKNADFRGVPLPRGALRIQNPPLDRIYEFVSSEQIKNSEMHEHEPDYRNTLYWNPDLERNSEGKHIFEFRTPDVTGSYIICARGFTTAGSPVSAYKVIKVTK